MPFDLIAAAREVIAIDTVSANGNLGLIATLKAAPVGWDCELRDLRGEGRRRRPGEPSLSRPEWANSTTRCCCSPTPTPSLPGPSTAGPSPSPFEPRLTGDKLYGLGSADVKVDLLCKLLAVERIPASALRRGVFVLGTYGEEIGLLGAKSFARQGPFRPRFVVCGEPSELTIIHAHKGYLVARVTLGQRRSILGGAGLRAGAQQSQSSVTGVSTRHFAGKAAHSSTPHLGDNAILKALADPLTGATSIRGGQGANSVPAECTVDLVSPGTQDLLPLAAARRLIARFSDLVAALSPSRDDRFNPPQAVTNLGYIEGRDGALEMLLDARLLPGHRPEALATVFEEEVHALGGSVVFERANPAVYTDPAKARCCQAAIRASRRLGLDPVLHTKATNTEAAAFAGHAEAIVFGPGPSVGNAHCPNEHTLVPQLGRAIDWYEALIRELCS